MTSFSCQDDTDYVSSQSELRETTIESRSTTTSNLPTLKRVEINPSGCDFGSFTIVDGMIRFDDFDSFMKTYDFLACASQPDYEDWQEQIQITTVKKQLIK